MWDRLPVVDSAFACSIYLCLGSLAWEYFSEIVRRAQNTFIELVFYFLAILLFRKHIPEMIDEF